MSSAFQGELCFPGIANSPTFVHAPRRERLCRAFYWHPHENLFWVQAFGTSDEFRQALLEFHVTCNSTWLIEQHHIKPAAGVRAEQLSPTDLAA